MLRSRDDDGRWQGRSASVTDINTPLSISLLIDGRRVAGQLVDDRNVIICGVGNGCDHPFPSLPAALAPTCPPLPSLSLLPFPPSIYFTAWPWQILPPARLSEPAVNRDWDPLVELGLLTRNACDRLHDSELIRPLRKLQLQLCVEELRQVRHINHCDWVDVHRAIGNDFD